MKRLVLLSALSACVVLSCTGHREVPAPDKKTDWLGLCGHSSECRAGLFCIEGLCTTRCEHANECARHAKDAICVAPSAAATCPSGSPLDVGRMCTLPCEARRQCAGRNRALSCVDAACALETCPAAESDAQSQDASVRDAAEPEAGDAAASDAAMRLVGAGEPDGGAKDAAANDASASDSGASQIVRDPCPATSDADVADAGLAPVPTMTTANLTRVALSARALAADTARSRVYALAAADDSTYPDQLVLLDSSTGAITDAIAVGANPTTIAMTDDGSTLWVGSLMNYEIRTVDLTTAAPVLTDTYALPADWQANTTNNSALIVVPPTTGAVSTLIDLRTSQGGAFIGQVTLSPGAALASPASGSVAERVAAGPPGYFFAYDDYSSDFGFYAIDARGDSLMPTEFSALINGYGRDIVYDPDGVVYATSGEVVDVRTPTAPRRSGTFALTGRFAPIPNSDRVLMVSTQSEDANVVHLLDTKTFSHMSWLQADGGFSSISSPVALGTDRVAFIATDILGNHDVYLSNALETNPPRAKVAPTSSIPGTLEFAIAARALVADPVRHVLYVAVGSGASKYENRIVTIDPERGEIVNSVPVGSNPVSLAISEDASVLWVGFTGSYSVRRVDLGCGLLAPGPEYDLPLFSHVGRLLPLSGSSGSFAAQIGGAETGTTYSNTVFYDDGVPRKPGLLGPQIGAARMVVGPPGFFFAYDDNDQSGNTFYTLQYDGSSVTQTAHGSLFSGQNNSIDIAYDPDGFVYAWSGDVVDVRNPLKPSHVGRFPFTGAGVMLPLPGPTAFMLSGSQLEKLDASTFSQVATIDACPDAAGTITDLVRASPGRLAYIAFESFANDSGLVCIVTNPELIP